MNKKSPSSLVIIVTSTIIAGITTMAFLYSQPSAATAKFAESDSSFNENSVVDKIIVPTTVSTSPVEHPLIQEVSGIQMEVIGTGIEEEYFTADVCYDLPSLKTDYVFTLGGQIRSSIALTTANETIQIYAWKIISGYDEDVNGNFQGNCARLYFPITSSTNLDNLTLTISRMSTPVADLPDCDKAQKKLDDAQQKIKVKCNKGGGFSVSEKPNNKSDEEARAIALDAFIDIVEGPWIFKLK